MIYKFLILSDEVNNFKREIEISPEATFWDLHSAILDATNFSRNEISSFFICDDNWRKKTEVTLFDMGASSEVDTFLMENTRLEELLEEEHQKLIYVFDNMLERSFFIDLIEIVPGRNVDKPVCSLEVGQPPVQTVSMEEVEKRVDNFTVSDDFYGDSEYSDDELDLDDMVSFDPETMDGLYEDERF
ncbi:MAG: hypothetical protein LBN71_04730 [Tannerella sp.]|jgi:hypothetical protein|nr:hypothetical protein [Tannerella sp.]